MNPLTDDERERLPDAVVSALCEAIVPIEPPGDRAVVMFERALAPDTPNGEDDHGHPGLRTLRREGAGWVEMLPGVRARLLQTDGMAQSWLVRIEPGARAPAHDHPDIEECIVLEGEVEYRGGARLGPGDYQIAQRGARHTELSSDTGALVFLRYGQPVENYLRPQAGSISAAGAS